jgi:hypothetical protein
MTYWHYWRRFLPSLYLWHWVHLRVIIMALCNCANVARSKCWTESSTATIFSSNCPPQKMRYMYRRWKGSAIAVVSKLTNGQVYNILFSNAYFFLFCPSLAFDPLSASQVQSVLLLRNGCRPVRPRVIRNRVIKIVISEKNFGPSSNPPTGFSEDSY